MVEADQEIMVAIGAGAILSSLIFYLNTRRFVRLSESTKGNVVGYGRTESSDGGMGGYTAIIRFCLNGNCYQFSSIISGKRGWPIGKTVKVLYDVSNPSNAHVDSFLGLYFLESICFIMGVLSLLFCFFI